jgi:hypothetical protein
MAGFPRITATTFSLRLKEMVCHPSYPLNSESASPRDFHGIFVLREKGYDAQYGDECRDSRKL